MDLVRDLLDKRVVDRNGRDMGRVDRIVLQLRADEPPRVAAIELGPSALFERLHSVLGCAARSLECAFGLADGRPVRIPVADIVDINQHVRVHPAIGETTAAAIEQRLRRWMSSLPLSS
jgi:sporulation protein YlmC with PRC-barrel domain